MEQRFTFNAVADDYDAFRPGYPPAVFEALRAKAPRLGIVLEVGCGTGKATEGLARAGFQAVALDPGPAMLEKARARVQGHDQISFREGVFEAFNAPEKGFAMICAAQAWHWVDPNVAYAKAASLLTPDGLLAIFGNVDAQIPEPLGSKVSAAFSKALGRPAQNLALGAYGPGGWISEQWERSGVFGPLEHQAFTHEVEHDAHGFATLASTYSDVRMLDETTRARLLDELVEEVERHGGRFVRTLETHLHVARPLPI